MNFPSKRMLILTTLGLLISGCGQASSVIGDSYPANETSLFENNNRSVPEPLETSAAEVYPVRIGVLTIDSALSVYHRYGPLIDHLSKTIGRPFELVPLTQESQFTAVEQGEIDFTTNNPLAAVQIQRLYETEFLVTHSRPNLGPEFSALIIVESGSSIQTLEDLKGKRVACVNFETAAAGCLFQVYHLLENNIDPFQDFGMFTENPSQDNIVLGVLNGVLDAGFIRTGQLQKMLKNGLLTDLSDVRILEPAADNFVFEHTTELYPEWPIAALPNTDPTLQDAVKSALLTLPDEHSALAAANVNAFVEAVDYQPIHDLIETLQLKSWDAD